MENNNKAPGNRKQRRYLAAVAARIKNRPGTGYSKRSAAKAKTPRKSAQLGLILQMKDNFDIIEKVSTGALDKYFPVQAEKKVAT